MVTIGKITKQSGVAGQVSYSVPVTYEDEDTHDVTFVGYRDGGPVVMILEGGAQTFVTDPGRFGTFGPDWVRRFFS